MTPHSLHLEKCSPAPAYSILAPEPIFADRHQLAVHLPDTDDEGNFERGLDFSDYQRMQTHTRAATFRHKPTPIYATDRTAMRKLIVRFMERRAQLPGAQDGPLPGTDAERMERAKAAIIADVPRLDALTTSLCQRYVDGRKNAASPEWLRRMEIEIENHDTQLRMARETPAILVGVLYRSYCLSESSVDVGAALGIKPPAVRALLSRFAQTWERMKVEDAW